MGRRGPSTRCAFRRKAIARRTINRRLALTLTTTGTMHRPMPYDPNSGRTLHRTKLEGEEAFA
jgi:hypothetical protein